MFVVLLFAVLAHPIRPWKSRCNPLVATDTYSFALVTVEEEIAAPSAPSNLRPDLMPSARLQQPNLKFNAYTNSLYLASTLPLPSSPHMIVTLSMKCLKPSSQTATAAQNHPLYRTFFVEGGQTPTEVTWMGAFKTNRPCAISAGAEAAAMIGLA